MKKLLFFTLLLVGLSASAQVEVSHNGFTIDSVGVTTVVKVTITARRIPTYIDAIIYTKSDNASTVGTDMFDAEAVPADKFRPLRIVNGVFWIKLEDADDVISIWW
jgi:hypothetical protein